MGFYSHLFKNRTTYLTICPSQIILVNIQKNNHSSNPQQERTSSNQEKHSRCHPHSTMDNLITFYYLNGIPQPQTEETEGHKQLISRFHIFNHGLVQLQYDYNVLLETPTNLFMFSKRKYGKNANIFFYSQLSDEPLSPWGPAWMTNINFCSVFWTTSLSQLPHWAWQILS